MFDHGLSDCLFQASFLNLLLHYYSKDLLSILCHYFYFSLLQPVHCLSVPHTVPSLHSMSLFLLLSATACPLSVSTSHCTVSQFYVTISTSLCYSLSTLCQYVTLTVSEFRVTIPTSLCYSLSTVSQYVTLYRISILCHYSHFSLLQPVHCLSVRHTDRLSILYHYSHFSLLQPVHCLSVRHIQSADCLHTPHYSIVVISSVASVLPI